MPGNLRLIGTLVLCVGYAAVMVGNLPYWLATGLFRLRVRGHFSSGSPAPTGAQRLKALAVAAVIAVCVAWAVTWVFFRSVPRNPSVIGRIAPCSTT